MNKKLRNPFCRTRSSGFSEYKELRVILIELRVKQWNKELRNHFCRTRSSRGDKHKELRVILKELRVEQWNKELRNTFCINRSSGALSIRNSGSSLRSSGSNNGIGSSETPSEEPGAQEL